MKNLRIFFLKFLPLLLALNFCFLDHYKKCMLMLFIYHTYLLNSLSRKFIYFSVLHFWWITQNYTQFTNSCFDCVHSRIFFNYICFPGNSNWFFSHSHFYCFISTYFLINYINVISYFVSLGILTCLLWNSEIGLLFLCHLEWFHCLFFKNLLVIFFFFWYDFMCLGLLVFRSNLSEKDFQQISLSLC